MEEVDIRQVRANRERNLLTILLIENQYRNIHYSNKSYKNYPHE